MYKKVAMPTSSSIGNSWCGHLSFETRGASPTLLKEEPFDTPFDYKLKIRRGSGTAAEERVDLVETFHYLIGLWVRTLRRHEHHGRQYVVSTGQIRGEDAVENVCVVWRDTKGLDLDAEAEWLRSGIMGGQTFDRVYINGLNKVRGAEPTEIAFREKMFEAVT